MRYAVILSLTFASCFGSATDGLTLACTKDRPACPDGLACVDGVCRQAGPSDSDAGVSSLDGGPGDLAMTYGCANPGGVSLGSAAFACPGTFATGGAAGRCAAGWKPCASATGIDLNLCNTLSGFFVADVPGSWSTSAMAPECKPTIEVGRESFFGCGMTGVYSFTANMPCAGFNRSLEASTINSQWNCQASGRVQTLADCRNNSPSDGILCCR